MPSSEGEPPKSTAAMLLPLLLLTASQVATAYVVGTGVQPNGNGCNTCQNPVQSQWGEWTAWSSCTTAYGTPSQTRTRVCASGNCPGGSDSESKPCALYDQPSVQPQWSSWGGWGQCSASCGGGQMTRTRLCNNGCSSCQCVGSSAETQVCNTQPCCSYSDWSAWSACSATCGNNGFMSRSRQCSCNGGCTGASTQQQQCYNQPACPCTTCQAPPPPPCTTCNQPVTPPPPPPPCTTCNQPPACSTCGPPQPFYDPYGNGRRKRFSAQKNNSTST